MTANVFTEIYKPESIIHRKEQIKEINKFFFNFKTQGHAGNIMLTGRTGTGKTATFKSVADNYKGEFLYASGSTNNSKLQILRALVNRSTGVYEKLINDLIKKLNEKPKIIVVDEVNKVKDMREMFDMLNTIFREVPVPIMTITNKPKMFNHMEEDTRKTLLFERIPFNPYDAEQLFDIVKSRVDIISKDLNFEIPEESLKRICAKCAEEGSARDALGTTFKCLISKDFSEKNIKLIEKKIEQEEWIDFVNSLKLPQRRFLKICLDLYAKGKVITNSSIQSELDVTPARISQLISYFVGEGIFESEYKYGSGKKRGRYRELTLSSHNLFLKLDGLL